MRRAALHPTGALTHIQPPTATLNPPLHRRADRTEAYDFIFDSDEVPLPDEYQTCSFAPVLSFYCSPRFADVPMPTTEDWEGAEGKSCALAAECCTQQRVTYLQGASILCD